VWSFLKFKVEVDGVIFSDTDSSPVPKFWNPGAEPGPAILQIWESDSCSDSGYNHRSNRYYPCFYLRNISTDSCNCRNGKVTPGPVFQKFLTPCLKEKRRILPDSTPVIRCRSHLWWKDGLISVGSMILTGVWTGLGFSYLKTFWNWINKFWNRCGVRNSYSGQSQAPISLPSPLPRSSITFNIHSLTFINFYKCDLYPLCENGLQRRMSLRGADGFSPRSLNGSLLLQLTASAWITQASTRERWQFGALNFQESPAAVELSRRDHSIDTMLHYHYIGISESR